ncbi:lamin tail domain-containing protein [Marinomonas sp. TW1]|uniref:lamin tail domain-containing protein n=1 Tax=Marinomonas sp. TW1 TaxID=1561203 RepID=UPI0007AFC89B|nr:lamin tail domain-containing protein [Marinomonas sp. TW1]KZN13053.1 hypothetical protein OA79_12945 [Marinomonas sp. TW1]
MSYFTNQLQSDITKTLESLASCPPIRQTEADDLWQRLNTLQALSQVTIKNIQYRGIPTQLDEFITIQNSGGLHIDISGWRIQAGSPKQQYVFPESSILAPYTCLQVDTSGDSNFNFQSNQPLWNNKGDLGSLLDDQNKVISCLAYGKSAHDKVVISHMNYDGEEHRSEGDEFVEISNISDCDVILDEWRLDAITNQNEFCFPIHTKLNAFTSIKVYTNKTDLKPDEFSFNSPRAIWNNSGGGCQLLDYQGCLVSEYRY